MISRRINIILGLIAVGGLIAFITGIAYSISTGFAGFWGGLPFWVISVTVLSAAVYNFYEETIKKK